MMATSGQTQTNTAFGYVRLAWSQNSQNIANNTTTISYTLSIYRSSNISSSAAKSYSVSINGVTVGSGTTTIGGSGIKTIKSGTVTIPHNADGTKTFAYSFSQQIDITWSGSWIGTVTGSGSSTLDTIPRATTPSISPSSIDMGSAIAITLNRASSSFTHRLYYSFGALSAQTTGISNPNSATTSATFTPPLTLANLIPNATSGTGTLFCETWSGSAKVGVKSVSFVVTIPSNVVPTISAVAISEAVTDPPIATKFSAYVQSKSKLAIATTAAGAYGSAIQSYKVTLKDSSDNALATYFGASVTTDTIPISGTVTAEVSVTDSRGRTATTTQAVTVLAYTPPKISVFSAFRANSDGTENYEGQYVNFTLKLDIAAVNNLNDKYYEIVYRKKGVTTWSTVVSSTSVYSVDGTQISGAVFDTDSSYDVALNVYDFFNSAAVQLDIPTAFTIMDFRSTGKGIAIGKVSEKDALEIALDVDLTGNFLQETRQTPTLQNNWVNYGGGYESASYWKDSCGVVRLAGLIKSGLTAAETVIFQLPAGYRPRSSEKFFCVSLNAICVIDVYSSGNIAIKTGANSGWLSLSGISFRSA